MPAKKKGGKKKGSTKKTSAAAPAPPPPIDLLPGQDYCRGCQRVMDVRPTPCLFERVRVRFSMIVWSFMDFDQVVDGKTSVRVLRDKIRARHGGSVHVVHLFRHKVAESNRLTDDFVTVDQLEPVRPSPDSAEPAELTIFYDFEVPSSARDPLLTADVRQEPARLASVGAGR